MDRSAVDSERLAAARRGVDQPLVQVLARGRHEDPGHTLGEQSDPRRQQTGAPAQRLGPQRPEHDDGGSQAVASVSLWIATER
jgi:hypothetical protein|eukprot:COSAG06_NODE_6507_length_2902_cov_1.591509_2_plen_83_part_00